MTITYGEAFFIWRRRRYLTQAQAGAKFHLTWRQIARVERNSLPTVSSGKLLAFNPSKYVFPLKPNEVAVLLRHRSKMTQAKLAKKLRCTRCWVNQMEKGLVDCQPLTNYWNERTSA